MLDKSGRSLDRFHSVKSMKHIWSLQSRPAVHWAALIEPAWYVIWIDLGLVLFCGHLVSYPRLRHQCSHVVVYRRTCELMYYGHSHVFVCVCVNTLARICCGLYLLHCWPSTPSIACENAEQCRSLCHWLWSHTTVTAILVRCCTHATICTCTYALPLLFVHYLMRCLCMLGNACSYAEHTCSNAKHTCTSYTYLYIHSSTNFQQRAIYHSRGSDKQRWRGYRQVRDVGLQPTPQLYPSCSTHFVSLLVCTRT